MRRVFLVFYLVIIFSIFCFGGEYDIIRFIVIPEKGLEEDEFTVLSINSILEYISDNSLEYVDYSILEDLKKKVRRVFEEKKGEEVNFSQLLAMESSANVYVEVSTKIEEKVMKNLTTSYSQVPSVDVKQFYVRIVLSAYDSSTARALGKTIVSTNVPVAGNTYEKIEKIVSKLSKDGFEDLLKKIKKYLEGGQLISVKVIGVRDLSYEKDISMIIDSSVGVRMKKRKSMTENYIDYDVIVKGNVDEFIDSFRDNMESFFPGKLSFTVSKNLVVVKIK